MLIEATGFGIILPVIPELVVELSGEPLSAAAAYGGWRLFVYALMMFFFAPIMGNLSDRFGRRPVLLVSLLALGVDYFIMGFATSLGWLFLGRLLSGIAGATYSTANAYIADVSPPEERTQNFALLGAAFGVGFILGPVLGGLLGEYGSRVPFFAAGCLSLLNVLYGFFVIAESLPRENRRPFSLRRANPMGALLQIRLYPGVLGLTLVLFLYVLGHQTYPSTWTYFTIERFNWSALEIGYSLGVFGLLMVLVQGGLIRWVIPRIGAPRAGLLGLAFTLIGLLGCTFATQGWMLYAMMPAMGLSGFSLPAFRGIISNQVPANAQGEIQGALASLDSLSAIIGPVLMTQLFAYFTAATAPIYFPGIAFFTAALLTLASLLLFIRTLSTDKLSLVQTPAA